MRRHFKQLRLPYIALTLIASFSVACGTPSLKVVPPTTPPTAPTSTISVTRDVIYATSLEDGGSDWTVDVYTPIETGKMPIVVLLHGLGANKEGYISVSEFLAENGTTVYTANWPDMNVDTATLDNGRGFREISETLNCVISFARTTVTDIGGDSAHVILVAHSYGSLYGAWIALASDDLDAQWEEFHADRDGPPEQVECARSLVTARVNAFIGVGGGRYSAAEVLEERDAELWEVVSPYAYLGRNSGVSIRLLHGEQDTIAKPESSLMFNEVLLGAGYDSHVILFDGGHIVPPQLTYETVIELTNE